MKNNDKIARREFLRNAVMLAGAGITAPLWAAMKYDRNVALRYFRESAKETDALLKGCRIDGVGFQAHAVWGANMKHVASAHMVSGKYGIM